jgi:hypothetical protein
MATCDLSGCQNFKPVSKPVEKEEWVDCTMEFFPFARVTAFPGDGWYQIWTRIGAGEISVVPHMTVLDDYRLVVNIESIPDIFRIERRVVKKVCKECGKEL